MKMGKVYSLFGNLKKALNAVVKDGTIWYKLD
jgi:hypothetical protein